MMEEGDGITRNCLKEIWTCTEICFSELLHHEYTFKLRLDTYWQDQEIIYDFHAQLQGTGSRSEVFRYN